ncbi:hypothetical protein L21SP5_00813 [Salinivirga cyanobacteriivorans]|uniref:DUF2279 domain-containing protein n=1 Tax=Salinivirga cyanobacteriivorans TaxID=1307839 RepID=A0A0S2HWZ8_9BACT|nr:DUF2279 domain-containing protein [Salinivirga cyanobacteriivorans]ALO14484.1 hypothetical protein L21SP5_00813 [Salinivirga cyanobacteriivorans]
MLTCSINRYRFVLLIPVIIIFTGFGLLAQNDRDSVNAQPRIKTWQLLAAEGAIYTGSMLVLSQAWYKDYPRSSFHWFNDNREWLQMDKIGHAYAGYQIAYQNAYLLRKTGLSRKKALLLSSGMAFAAMSSIELFDGYSSEWGASSGDIIANSAGVVLFGVQELLWESQIIRMKYGYRASPYASKKPEILGENMALRLIKDYNAQSYWLSFSINKVTGLEKIPPWVAFAAGYSAGGMVGGKENTEPFQNITRYRQFLLSPDIDWQSIPTNKKYLKILFRILNTVKIPMPALSFQKGGIKLYGWQ